MPLTDLQIRERRAFLEARFGWDWDNQTIENLYGPGALAEFRPLRFVKKQSHSLIILSKGDL